MNEIFILIRLPVFLLGVVISTLFLIGAGAIFIPVTLFVVPVFFLFALPFRFVWAALTNDAAGFSQHVRGSVYEWKKTILDMLKEPEKTYRGLFHWFIGK